jgi:hypothetical protein
MPRAEKFVASLAVAVLVAGFAVGGIAEPTNTRHQGSLSTTEVASFRLDTTTDWPRAVYKIEVNGSNGASESPQITCRSAVRATCAALGQLVCAELFNCAAYKVVRANTTRAGNRYTYTFDITDIQPSLESTASLSLLSDVARLKLQIDQIIVALGQQNFVRLFAPFAARNTGRSAGAGLSPAANEWS